MSQILSEQLSKNQLINRESLIQLLYDEIIFLGKIYNRSKNSVNKKNIKKAGLNLQKILKRQKKNQSLILSHDNYQKYIIYVYQTIEGLSKKV